VKLHLVGGFLGSGKTTAIIAAARQLMRHGKSVGVITNDQGRYLVDTAFYRASDIPAVEVTGGCFCSHYDELEDQLEDLVAAHNPDVIFAEAVGSSADLVGTVARPLRRLPQIEPGAISLTVFADSRLLYRRLRDEPLPFSDEVLYIFDKQIEGAGLLVVNKIDLLPADKVEELKTLLKGRAYLLQNTLAEQGVGNWLAYLEPGDFILPGKSPRMDYEHYGRAEAALAWLDEAVELETTPGQEKQIIESLIRAILDGIRQRGGMVAHLKFWVRSGGFERKISFSYREEPGWEDQLPESGTGRAALLVNARVELPAEDLRRVVRDALAGCGAAYREADISCFRPAQPVPTHRAGGSAVSLE